MFKYLSPSALKAAEKQPFKFYLQKILRIYPWEKSSLAAGCGTSFDYEVKQDLISRDVPCEKEVKPVEGFSPKETEKLVSAGKELLNKYRVSGQLFNYNWQRVEKHITKEIEGVPIHGQLDATVLDEETGMEVPHDFKVSGYTSKTGATPKIGYRRKWDLSWGKAHKKYRPDISIDEIDSAFALQFASYGLLLGLEAPFPVYFDHICYNGKKKKIVIAEYRAWVTEEFANSVIARYVDLWKSLHDGTFVNRLKLPESILSGESEFTKGTGHEYLLFLLAKSESWF